jgi:hypothetical protein
MAHVSPKRFRSLVKLSKSLRGLILRRGGVGRGRISGWLSVGEKSGYGGRGGQQPAAGAAAGGPGPHARGRTHVGPPGCRLHRCRPLLIGSRCIKLRLCEVPLEFTLASGTRSASNSSI